MKIPKSSIVSVSGADDNKVICDSGGISRLNRLKNWLSPKTSKSGNPKSGNSIKSDNSKAIREYKFLIFKARDVFNCLKKAFTKRAIFRHLDPEYHIQIETDISGHAISKVLG